MRFIDMHDYPPAARRVWWAVFLAGAPITAWAAYELTRMPWPQLATALAGLGFTALVALHPIRFPGTKIGATAGEAFIFFMLLMFGVSGGIVAAVVDGVFAGFMGSKRWTSRLGTPACAAVGMAVCGLGFVFARDAALAAGLGPAAHLAAAIAIALPYFAATYLLGYLIIALKGADPVRPIRWLRQRAGVGVWYMASAAIAGLLHLTFEQFGWPVLVVALPMVLMAIVTWHAVERAENASRHKSAFLANMSHELRTPLNCIVGGSELLKEGMVGPLTPAQARWAGDIHEAGTHLLLLINDILDLSKIEAGRMELDLDACDVRGVIEHAAMLVGDAAARKGLSVTVEAADAGTLVADPRKLKQVLVNLLANAVKFTPQGGQVTVRARRVNGGVEIGVADTGVGIARQDQAALFEPFRQVGPERGERAAGTGLGLALVRDLVLLHGGTVQVESQPGQGSTFTVRLPDRDLQRARAVAVQASMVSRS